MIASFTPQALLGVLSLAVAAGLYGQAFSASDQGGDVFARTGYWIMLGMSATWAAALRSTLKPPVWREWRLPALYAAVGVAICFLSTPIGFKVLSDETNLLAVSESLYQHKTAVQPIMGKFYFDNFHATFVSIPTRPLVFPFLLSIIHCLLGFHAWNAFVLNAAVLFVLLFVICLAVQRSLGPVDACAAAFLVLSQPIVMISATSGGFDLLSALGLLALLLACRQHIHSPSADSLSLVWMALLVYAQIRYESILALPLVMSVFAALGYISLNMIVSRIGYYAAAPLFLFPWIMQRHLNRNSFENPPGTAPFSAEHFANHFLELIEANLDFQFFYPYNNVLNIAAVVMLLALLVREAVVPTGKKDYLFQSCIIISVLTVGVSLIVFLAHHMGKAGHPTQSRFFLPLALALTAVPLLVRRLHPQWISSSALLFLSVALFITYQPVAGESRMINTLLLTRETRLTMEYISAIGHQRILTISDRPGQYAALGVGAVDFATSRDQAEEIMQEVSRHLYDDVLVFQHIDYQTDQPSEQHQVSPLLPIETAAEYQLTSETKLRISRLSRPDAAALDREASVD